MKVVLRTDVDGLGYKGDIVSISDGYAQNKLIPQGLAYLATAGAEKEAEKMRQARELRASEEKAMAEEMASRMENETLTIAMNAGEGGKLFGSVSATDISEALSDQKNITIDKKLITVAQSIKEIGIYQVEVKPHPDVEFTISLDVVTETN
jgi:large subunit ribosomal protein L9